MQGVFFSSKFVFCKSCRDLDCRNPSMQHSGCAQQDAVDVFFARFRLNIVFDGCRAISQNSSVLVFPKETRLMIFATISARHALDASLRDPQLAAFINPFLLL